jgi:sterol desaturase/sphingolipid hydroxylase (fatty acid hydroxylase superfamily)
MVLEFLKAVVENFVLTLIGLGPYVLTAAVIFPLLSLRFSCNDSVPWWRRKGLLTDFAYWFVIPIFTRFIRIGLLSAGAALLFGIHGSEDLAKFFENGHGPVATLPLWAQIVLYLVVSDFLLYWVHRIFHGSTMWKYHAIHHSPEDVDWISAARFHPVNLVLGTVMVDVVLLLAGIAPAALGLLAPFNVMMSAFVHANLNWTLGPFKYVLASPVFHRWHHTAAERGGSKNFAGTFPIWDMMFGTFYMPKNELPDAYGVDEPDFPHSFGAQLLYPFKQKSDPGVMAEKPAGLIGRSG